MQRQCYLLTPIIEASRYVRKRDVGVPITYINRGIDHSVLLGYQPLPTKVISRTEAAPQATSLHMGNCTLLLLYFTI